MALNAKCPGELSNVGNLSDNWSRWKKEFQTYIKTTKYSKGVQVYFLKDTIGPIGLKALEKISFKNSEDKEDIIIVLEKLDSVFCSSKNEIQERVKFFSASKKKNESIDEFIENLMEMSKSCNFGKQTKSLVRDAIILDIKDESLQNILLEEKDLTLDKLKIIYKTYEGINSGIIKDEPKTLIAEKETESSTATEFFKRPCWRCANRHPLKNCPAFKILCNYCKHYSHFTQCCPLAKVDKVKNIETSNTAPSNENQKKIENKLFSSNSAVNKSPSEITPKNLSTINNLVIKDSAFIASSTNLKIEKPHDTVENSQKIKNKCSSIDFKKPSSVSSQKDLAIQLEASEYSSNAINLKCAHQYDIFCISCNGVQESTSSESSKQESQIQKLTYSSMEPSAPSENLIDSHNTLPPSYKSLYPQLPTETPTINKTNTKQTLENMQGPTLQDNYYNYSQPNYPQSKKKFGQKTNTDCTIQ